jgi:hypothetical protein
LPFPHQEREPQMISTVKETATTTTATATKRLFPLGQMYATPGAIEALSEAGQGAAEFINRHQRGDWSEMCEEDRRENEFSIDKRLRIFSAYHTSKGDKLWVITEADRSVTTILLPSEY